MFTNLCRSPLASNNRSPKPAWAASRLLRTSRNVAPSTDTVLAPPDNGRMVVGMRTVTAIEAKPYRLARESALCRDVVVIAVIAQVAQRDHATASTLRVAMRLAPTHLHEMEQPPIARPLGVRRHSNEAAS